MTFKESSEQMYGVAVDSKIGYREASLVPTVVLLISSILISKLPITNATVSFICHSCCRRLSAVTHGHGTLISSPCNFM
jgi:hypothetical protein